VKQAKRVKYVDLDELKSLWRMLERLQADVQPGGGGYVWNDKERAALVTVMDAVKDSYSCLPIPSARQEGS
jgi:hypothetical protein